ncbi:GCN5 family acetyltransferase [Sphingomonas sp. Leaf357]|uniref:GNAT family N-acetyltransferase n=1 Tax=Sphingomonas sp. Leaf357 TaxID=1736350 RepID=UPI0007020EF6|nr:GNAT family N-acetyltransferase [Sphingomonas sp. Leaf357]KQS04742.1 GCN5 family acetyltransferase [Sphingomonas sp. Leaf357]
MIETERLILRRYDDARDRAAMRAMCDDPEVMRYLLPVPDDAAHDAMVARMDGYLADFGYTFWTVERRADGAILGVCGLKPGAPDTPIADAVEIGWRFARPHWGQGYAREAAQASLDWAWANLDCAQVVAITVQRNSASWGLMERLGMTRVRDGDFDHPLVPDDSPLKRHILYRIDRPA